MPLPTVTRHTLADVLPSILHGLGVAILRGVPLIPVTPSPRAVVVLVDGLGDRLLRRRSGHAPFLRASLGHSTTLTCGFPSTTATSMGSFGIGELAGAHGMVGFEMFDPERDVVFNGLSWDNGPDPRQWQPHATTLELAEAAGVTVTRIGPGYFDGSGLTIATLRGGSFRAARTLADRVDAAVTASGATARSLVYLYWGELDKTGHAEGVNSWQWGDELEAIDAELARLVAHVPADTAVYLTADHGMVDVPFTDRLDLADEPALREGVRHTSGEPRALGLHCVPGAVADVAAAWRTRLGPLAQVETRADAVAARRYGDVSARVLARIPDLLVLCDPTVAIVDSATMRPALLTLLGLHGSVTPDETEIPFVQWPARVA